MHQGEEDPKKPFEGAVVGVKDFVKSALEEGSETLGKMMKLFEGGTGSAHLPRQLFDNLMEQMRLSYDEVEKLIAEKVAEVLDRLGWMPTDQQIKDLSDRVDSLTSKLEAFSNSRKSKGEERDSKNSPTKES